MLVLVLVIVLVIVIVIDIDIDRCTLPMEFKFHRAMDSIDRGHARGLDLDATSSHGR